MKYIIDENGEIIDELYEGDKILRINSIEALRNTKNINNKEEFIKIYTRAIFDIYDTLSAAEGFLLFYLLRYADYNNGILRKNGISLTRKTIIDETGKHEDIISKLLNNLIRKEILMFAHSGKDKRIRNYIINPYIFMKGNRVSNMCYELFKNTKWAIR